MKSSGPSAIHQPSIAIPDPHSSGSRSVASSVISPVKNSKKQTTGQTIFHITIQIPEIGRLIMSWMSSDSGCVRWTDSLWTTTALRAGLVCARSFCERCLHAPDPGQADALRAADQRQDEDDVVVRPLEPVVAGLKAEDHAEHKARDAGPRRR